MGEFLGIVAGFLRFFAVISLVMFPNFWWGDLYDTKLSPKSIHRTWYNTGLPDVLFKVLRNGLYIMIIWALTHLLTIAG